MKSPVVKTNAYVRNSHLLKKASNKKIRHMEEVGNGTNYKKNYEIPWRLS